MQVDDLITQIRGAFADTKYPGDDKLLPISMSTEGEVHTWGEDTEPYEVKKAFLGKNNWQELGADFIDQAPNGLGSAMCFLSAEAFQFYMPAYLIADLEGKFDRNDMVFHLTYGLDEASKNNKIAKMWGGGTVYERAVEKYSVFTEDQAKAIVAFLRFRFDSDGEDPWISEFDREQILDALNKFWLTKAGEK